MELIPPVKYREFDANGDPLAGGKVYTYLTGTTTPRATYTSQTGGTANANPVILDANGEADIWISTGYYKFIITDANDVVLKTVDKIGIAGSGATSLTAGGTTGQILSKTSGTDYDCSWVDFNQAPTITGTRAAPSAIVAATGVAFTGALYENVWFIQGSGGAVTVTANPQIAAATNAGQRLTLIGRSDTNTVTFADGTGLVTGGQTIIMGANSITKWFWDGSAWVLESTNGLI